MSSQDKQKIAQLREGIRELSGKLTPLKQEKEGWLEKKRNLRVDISKLFEEFRQGRAQRDQLTSDVSELKKRRAELREEIKKKIAEFRSISKKRKEIAEKYKIAKSPSQIAREIEAMEFKIETSGMPFEGEQKLMKVIKQKKAELARAESLGSVWEDSKKVSDEISALKKEAERVHSEIQVKAKLSQERHEKLISISQSVDELKSREKEAVGKFLDMQKEFSEANASLQQRLLDFSKAKGELNDELKKVSEQRRMSTQRLLEEKEKEVNEKLKSGKKLTTKDLLIFQNKN